MDESRLKHILSALGLSSCVETKAVEILRKINIRIPMGTSRQLDTCRYAVSVEISCRILNQPFDKAAVIVHSGIGKNDYLKMVTTVKTALDLNWSTLPLVDIFGIRFGDHIKRVAVKILEGCRVQSKHAGLDTNAPANVAAAFSLALKKQNVSIKSNCTHDLRLCL